MLRFAPLALLPLALASPLIAQDDSDPYAACAAMTESAARLTCFDSTYAQQNAGRMQRVEEQRADNFGLGNSAPARDEPEEDEEEAEFTLTATINEAFIDGLGKRVLLLENGQLWRETNSSTMRGSPPIAGSQASITQSWSGAYQMRIDGRRGFIRITRIR